jgi:hypothetical protein
MRAGRLNTGGSFDSISGRLRASVPLSSHRPQAFRFAAVVFAMFLPCILCDKSQNLAEKGTFAKNAKCRENAEALCFKGKILGLNGAQGRNRTTDTRIFNPLLYP